MRRFLLPGATSVLTFAVGVIVSIAVHGTTPEINPVRLVHRCFHKVELRHEPEATATLELLAAECGAAYSNVGFAIENRRSKKIHVHYLSIIEDYQYKRHVQSSQRVLSNGGIFLALGERSTD